MLVSHVCHLLVMGLWWCQLVSMKAAVLTALADSQVKWLHCTKTSVAFYRWLTGMALLGGWHLQGCL